MKTYRTVEELKSDVVDNALTVDDSISIEFELFMPDLSINAEDINAEDITARNITAWNIDAWNINASDIKACNINARDIHAGDITYFAVCCAYRSFSCKSIKGTRENSRHFCLDGDIEIREAGE